MGRYLSVLKGNGDIDHFNLLIITLREELGRLVRDTVVLH